MRVDPMDMNPICTGISSLQMPIMPKSFHSLPSSSKSEPIHHNSPCANSGKLLVEWPRRMSGNAGTRKIRQPRVTFSESSSMQMYHLDQLYAHTKSYSKDDCKRFSRESQMEAARIKKLVHSFTSPGVSTEESFKYLIKNDAILLEEIRGIEHLILCNSASKFVGRRRDHTRSVLTVQHRMETLARDQMKIQDDLVEILARFSASRSSRSSRDARTRASRAA